MDDGAQRCCLIFCQLSSKLLQLLSKNTFKIFIYMVLTLCIFLL